MSKNVEINISNGSGYEVLYPKTLGSLVDGVVSNASVASDLSLTLAISKGGTNGTTASSAMYNLINPLSNRTASQLNSYASSTYIPCYYSSTGYKFSLNNIINSFKHDVISRRGTDSTTEYSVNFTFSPDFIIIYNGECSENPFAFGKVISGSGTTARINVYHNSDSPIYILCFNKKDYYTSNTIQIGNQSGTTFEFQWYFNSTGTTITIINSNNENFNFNNSDIVYQWHYFKF